MHAAIAREQLKRLPGFIDHRLRNAAYFRSATLSLPITIPESRGKQSPFGLQFMVASQEARSALAEALRAAGIDCRLPTGGSFRLAAYGARWRDQQTPQADEVHRRGLFCGNGPKDLSDEIGRAVKVMKEILT
jgi:CDP-6-deoxy-D-xylo-4-hexulose-3-dehydrase